MPYDQITAEHRPPREVLEAAKHLLANARQGLEDIESDDPSRRLPGLHNVAVFGRSVTFALQRLRKTVDGFDDWYKSKIPTDDPLLNYFNRLRNDILKEASLPRPSTSSYIAHLNTGNMNNILKGAPPQGASGIFIGESGTGGSGWIVKLPDGTEEKYYAQLGPSFDGSVTINLPDAPQSFLGETFEDTTVSGIARRYVIWLDNLVKEAGRLFVTG